MELINNTTKTLKDDLSVEIKQGSKLSIAAACFSIYAFQELKEQLSQIEELRFIFTSPTFVTEKAKKERREFYIPRLTRERNLYGTEFEIKLRNELTQKAIARECAEWIRQKVTFKSNVSDKSIQGQIVVDGVGYTPINNFTTVELGCEKGNVISTTIVKDESLARTLLADFNEIWNDSKVLQVVTDEVIDSITVAYNENSPDFIYFVTLYNIFSEFLEDVSEDVLPNEATGFKESKIWGMLYNFQKDAALAIINKLEKYNGCILADSVGLGKTFTALAVIKYYENRNKSVLVLCPKKLTNNWNTYKDNYVNNPIAADRLRYDVLYHTDLNRTHGNSNGLDLSRLNWGKHIIPYFEPLGVTLAGLQLRQIQSFYLHEAETLKNTSILRFHANLHKALKYAVRIDLIASNPVDKVDRPKPQAFMASYYSAEEMEKLFEAAQGHKLELIIQLAAFYGLRRAEVMGLRWEAIDFEAKTLTIRHIVTSTRIDGKKILVEADRAKTKSSLRTLPLVDPIAERLKAVKEQQEYNQKICGNCYNQEYLGYVFVDAMGNLIQPDSVTTGFPQLLKENGLRRIRFHDLRHSCASLLLKEGVPMKQIQEWLGHSDISTTANIYAHMVALAKHQRAGKQGHPGKAVGQQFFRNGGGAAKEIACHDLVGANHDHGGKQQGADPAQDGIQPMAELM